MRTKIRQHFYKHKDIKDQRIIDMLLETGYIDLEDTLLQHKQKPQLMLLLEGRAWDCLNAKNLSANSTVVELFSRLIL